MQRVEEGERRHVSPTHGGQRWRFPLRGRGRGIWRRKQVRIRFFLPRGVKDEKLREWVLDRSGLEGKKASLLQIIKKDTLLVILSYILKIRSKLLPKIIGSNVTRALKVNKALVVASLSSMSPSASTYTSTQATN